GTCLRVWGEAANSAMSLGTPPMSIKWFKEDNEVITGGACFIRKESLSSFLELHSVKPLDSGKYTCQVSNDAGKVSCTAVLFVKEPPTFTKKLDASKLLMTGSSVHLECKVTGTPEIQIKWLKNESEISAGDTYQMSFTEDVASLHIFNASVEESGDYICEASWLLLKVPVSCHVSGEGKVGQTSDILKKKSPFFVLEPPSFHKVLESMDVVKGTDVILQGEVIGTAPFDALWYRDSKPVRSSKKYKIMSQNGTVSLHILKCDAADIGKYQCTVSNDVGTASCDCDVTLKDPPSFIEKIENVSCLVGSVITLQSIVKGSLPITVSWIKDDNEVMESDNTQMTFEDGVATLYMTDVETLHAGKYTCQAKNDAGAQKCSASVLVKGQSAQCTMR
uniref:Ig-like domain-containing protein n=1 Tax=Erpetoichthys calabaricus TaxID=27687 RepID=A0A8C4S5P7_ERPCA